MNRIGLLRVVMSLLTLVGVSVVAQPEPDPLLPTRQADLFADAERRSLLRPNQASHDGRFFIQSADGSKRLNIGGYAQIRYYANLVFAPTGPLSADTESEAGAVTVRLESALFGNKGDFSDMTSLGTEEPGLLIGAATHWQGETLSFFVTEINNLTQGTVDISYETPGYNLFGATVIRHIEFPSGGDEIDLGALAQAGVFVSGNVEAFGRYTVLVPDSDATGDDPFHELLAGATWFVAGHAIKVTGDVQYFFQSPSDTTLVGFGPTPGTGF